MTYDELLLEADSIDLITKEKPLKAHKGRIKGNRIAIKKDLTTSEKACTLAEELAHHYTSVGDILDQSQLDCQKQELRARLYAYDKLIGLRGIVECFEHNRTTTFEMADYLNVTEPFLRDALRAYTQKYGACVKYKHYIIDFEPTLNVREDN